MNAFLKKIPIVRSIIRDYNKLKFDREWRKRNPHNDTVAGNRMFLMDSVRVGESTYGMLNIQNFFPDNHAELRIGNYVSIAPGVLFLLDVNHQTETYSTFPFHTRLVSPTPKDAVSKGNLIVEDEVWLGTNAIIMSGLSIGKGAIVAAGSIVTKSVPSYAIVGGNPAKIIRFRFSEEIISVLKEVSLTGIPKSQIAGKIHDFYKKIETMEDAVTFKKMIDELKSKS